jgi:hypothetical protein
MGEWVDGEKVDRDRAKASLLDLFTPLPFTLYPSTLYPLPL